MNDFSTKAMHFAFAGFLTAFMTIVVVLQDLPVFVMQPWRMMFMPCIGTIVSLFATFIKVFFFDEQRNYKLFVYVIVGCATVFIAVLLGILFFLGSN